MDCGLRAVLKRHTIAHMAQSTKRIAELEVELRQRDDRIKNCGRSAIKRAS
jgi:hypothetical protein